MKRKTLIKRFKDALSKKESKKIKFMGVDVDFYPSKNNPKEGLIVSWELEERMAKYFYNYYNSRDIILFNGDIIKGVDEYYAQLILFGLNQNLEKPLTQKYFNRYNLYIRNPDKSINDSIYIVNEDYDIQKKDDLAKINGLFDYISDILIDKKEVK